jgi:hypothetical protein
MTIAVMWESYTNSNHVNIRTLWMESHYTLKNIVLSCIFSSLIKDTQKTGSKKENCVHVYRVHPTNGCIFALVTTYNR